MTGAISIYCYQEALAIIGENKPVLLALAQALIDHPERPLNAAETDAVISQTLAREALAAEQGRRAVWRRTIENAASFGDPLGCNTWGRVHHINLAGLFSGSPIVGLKNC